MGSLARRGGDGTPADTAGPPVADQRFNATQTALTHLRCGDGPIRRDWRAGCDGLSCRCGASWSGDDGAQSKSAKVRPELPVAVIEQSLIVGLIGAPAARDPLSRLTVREWDVHALVAEGRTDRGMPTQPSVTRKTVEAHVRSIFQKLDLPTHATENRRVHAVLAYLRHGSERSPGP